MELRARVQIQGKPGRLGGRTKQTEAAWAKGVVPLRYFICVFLFFFFFSFLVEGKGTDWKGDRKTKSKRETPMTSLPATPGPRPEPMRVRMNTHSRDSNNLGDWGNTKSVFLDSTAEEAPV